MKSVGSIRIAHQTVCGDEWRPTLWGTLDAMGVGTLKENECVQP
jgi:hypothetical protein